MSNLMQNAGNLSFWMCPMYSFIFPNNHRTHRYITTFYCISTCAVPFFFLCSIEPWTLTIEHSVYRWSHWFISRFATSESKTQVINFYVQKPINKWHNTWPQQEYRLRHNAYLRSAFIHWKKIICKFLLSVHNLWQFIK